MNEITNFIFTNKTFCFTGKLAELKRTQAEREVRSRSGLTIDSITPQLDYLVIGSIPSPAWKYGDFGSKIDHARELKIVQKNKPVFVPESYFMEALSNFPVVENGEVDEKIIVYKYTFIEEDNNYDYSQLDDLLELLQGQENTFVSKLFEEAYYSTLFTDTVEFQEKTKIICRIVKKIEINSNSQEIVDNITKGFESIAGLDGNMKWYERNEGTSSYVKLLKELPKYKRK